MAAILLPILLFGGAAVAVAGAQKKRKRRRKRKCAENEIWSESAQKCIPHIGEPSEPESTPAADGHWSAKYFPKGAKLLRGGPRTTSLDEAVEFAVYRMGDGAHRYVIRATKLGQHWPSDTQFRTLPPSKFPTIADVMRALGNDIAPKWITSECKGLIRSENYFKNAKWLGPNAAWACGSAGPGETIILGEERAKDGSYHQWRVIQTMDPAGPYVVQIHAPGEPNWQFLNAVKHAKLAAAQGRVAISKGWRP